MGTTIKSLNGADRQEVFARGRFDAVEIAGMTLGRAKYEPGWKWSVDVGRALGKVQCDVRHVGVVLSGHAKVQMEDGREFDLRAGDVFEIEPGHDSWVVGDEPYVSLHVAGADRYAK